jgi:oxidase EvaA
MKGIVPDGVFNDLAEFHDWFDHRRRSSEYRVTPRPLEELDGWRAKPGVIEHRSGKFFSITGLEVETDHRDIRSWAQPIIVQPEIGILGLVVKVINGAVHCLMQAKMEPGNINLLQLSPTVQATRSNYTRVHQGRPVPYLDHFLAPRGGRTVFDALQSEQGSWFLGKRNRNMIVEVGGEIPVHEGFCWLSLPQIALLMGQPNLVNMDSRTALSGMPFLYRDGDDEGAWHTFAELLSWFTESKTRYRLSRRLVSLDRLPGWKWSGGRITYEDGRYFTVLGMDVRASGREVASWSQPMLEPAGRGFIAFLGRRIDGAFHVLVHVRTEAGTHDVVEMSPTVSCIPGNYLGSPKPRFFDAVDWDSSSDHLVDVVHSEEGGRFWHAESRYVITDVGEDFDLDVPDDYCWMTVAQLTRFVRFGNHVNVAARCLLSCLVGETTSTAVVGS